jgi:hypothetical protein
MIISGTWLIVATILKGLGIMNLDIKNDIIPIAITLVCVFSPVYCSIILDKIKELKGLKQ